MSLRILNHNVVSAEEFESTAVAHETAMQHLASATLKLKQQIAVLKYTLIGTVAVSVLQLGYLVLKATNIL